jgi:hypothetical protein
MDRTTILNLIAKYETALENAASFKSLSADGVSKTNHDLKAIMDQLQKLYILLDREDNGMSQRGRVGGGIDVFKSDSGV